MRKLLTQWFSNKQKKPIKHRAIDELPYKGREVIVQRGEGYHNPSPFSAILTSHKDNICWIGTCGDSKDLYITLDPTDTWYYSYYNY